MSDLIDRQAAIDAFDGVKVDEGWCTEYDIGYNDGIDLAISMLSVLSSVQPERKRGVWKSDRLVSTNGGTYGVGRCSECEAYFQGISCGWNFCPNCGAKMEVSAEE